MNCNYSDYDERRAEQYIGNRPRFFLPGCYVQYVHFDGLNNAAEIQNEREFNGSLFTILPQLDSFIRDAIVWQKPVPISVLREKTVTNYPFAALLELVMNACMHRDYQSNTPIRLYQYSDRIEIMNAGGLYGEARPELLVVSMEEGWYAAKEIELTPQLTPQLTPGVKPKQQRFNKNYLLPAVEAGLIERLYPNNPRHPKQRYRLTALGLEVRQYLNATKINSQK